MIAVEPRRAEALKIGYEATDWLKVPGFEEYTEFMDEWTVELLVRNGEPIGAIYTRGPEFHISTLPEWRGRWATRSILKRIIPRPLAITLVTPGFEHVGNYLVRLGFERHGIYYVREHHGH